MEKKLKAEKEGGRARRKMLDGCLVRWRMGGR